MSRTTCQIEILRPPGEVFRWLDEPDKAVQWLSSLEEMTPLTEGGNRVGARAKHVYNENGRRIEVIEETLAYEPDRHVELRGESDAFTVTVDYTLTPTDRGTLLEFAEEMRFANGFLRLLSPLFASSSRRRALGELERLKKFVEGA